jgi:hypothetical protein
LGLKGLWLGKGIRLQPPAVMPRRAACRKLHQSYIRVQAGSYSLTPLMGMELKGKTVGVLALAPSALRQHGCSRSALKVQLCPTACQPGTVSALQ